jgi:hypothetical protein
MRRRLRLADVAIFLVVGALALATVRKIGDGRGLELAVGVILAPLAVVIASLLALRVVRGQARDGRSLDPWERSWRATLAMLLALYAWAQASALSSSIPQQYVQWGRTFPDRDIVAPRRVIAICGVIGFIGLALGCGPVSARRQKQRQSRSAKSRQAWSLALGVYGGLLLLLVGAAWQSFVFDWIDYLVLLAIEGVANAQRSWAVMDRLNLHERSHAALPALMASTLAWSVMMAWLVGELRNGPAQSRGVASRAWRLGFEALSVAITGALGILLWRDTIPRFSPEFTWAAEQMLSRPRTAWAIVLGFAMLSAGLAARSASMRSVSSEGSPPSETAQPRRTWLARFMPGLMLLLIALGAVWIVVDTVPYIINHSFPEAAWVPEWVRDRDPPWWWHWIPAQAASLLSVPGSIPGAPTRLSEVWYEYLAPLKYPESWAVLVSFVVLLVIGVITLWRRRHGGVIAFDVAGERAPTSLRFAGLCVAWFVVLIVSLPMFGLAGLLVRVEMVEHLWLWPW